MKHENFNLNKTGLLLSKLTIVFFFAMAILSLSNCTDAYAPIDMPDEPEQDSFDISDPALHPHCASDPDSLPVGDLWGKDMQTETVFRIDSIDISNEMTWCEPVWSETGATVCTGNVWRWYGDQDLFQIKCKEDFGSEVEDTCQ